MKISNEQSKQTKGKVTMGLPGKHPWLPGRVTAQDPPTLYLDAVWRCDAWPCGSHRTSGGAREIMTMTLLSTREPNAEELSRFPELRRFCENTC